MSPKLIGGFVAVALVLLVVVWYTTRPPKGLYMLGKRDTLSWNGTNYTGGTNYAGAVSAVKAVGGVIPTKTQLAAFFTSGWDVCSWGWFIDDTKNNTPTAMYATKNTESGCGGPGVIVGSTDQSNTWYVYGYGPRPANIPDNQWMQEPSS